MLEDDNEDLELSPFIYLVNVTFISKASFEELPGLLACIGVKSLGVSHD